MRSGEADSDEPLDEEDELITLDDDVLDEGDGRKTLATHHHEAGDDDDGDAEDGDEEVDAASGEDESHLSADDELIPDDDPN